MTSSSKLASEKSVLEIADEQIIDGILPDGLQSITALHNPFDWYADQRSISPVQYDRCRGVYDVFTYKDVKRGLRDSDRFVRPSLTDNQSEDQLSYFDTAMLWSEGTDHRRQKRQLFQYFNPNSHNDIEKLISSITQSQLDVALDGGGEFDFVDDFAVPVSLRIVLELVGIQQDDYDQIRSFLTTFRRSVMPREESARDGIKKGDMTDAANYFEQFVTKSLEDAEAGLITQFVNQTDLGPEEIGANCFDFVSAGQGTMSELLTNALYSLDEHGLTQSIGGYDLEMILEEVLRYRSPLQARARKTTEAVTLNGTDIPKGEKVILWIGAANRDPARYDRPNAFIPDRKPEHLAFGEGPHKCIAGRLARTQARIILRTLFDEISSIEIKDDSVVPKPVAAKLGFDRMPVRIQSR